jgi:hypothetical protein
VVKEEWGFAGEREDRMSAPGLSQKNAEKARGSDCATPLEPPKKGEKARTRTTVERRVVCRAWPEVPRPRVTVGAVCSPSDLSWPKLYQITRHNRRNREGLSPQEHPRAGGFGLACLDRSGKLRALANTAAQGIVTAFPFGPVPAAFRSGVYRAPVQGCPLLWRAVESTPDIVEIEPSW